MEKSFSALIGNYVHRANNIVGGIRAYAMVFKMERADLINKDSDLAGFLDRVEIGTEEMLSLTEKFDLYFRSPKTAESISVKTILTQALQDSVLPKSVNVFLDIQEGLPEVRATKNLVDVFRNLCSNAVEAMPDGGNLQVSARVNQSKDKVEINFTDTGQGMPSYVTDSLFQPYFSTKREKGHGLGLWWSKVYLESIGGNIELLRSEVGKGTSFLVSISLSK